MAVIPLQVLPEYPISIPVDDGDHPVLSGARRDSGSLFEVQFSGLKWQL